MLGRPDDGDEGNLGEFPRLNARATEYIAADTNCPKRQATRNELADWLMRPRIRAGSGFAELRFALLCFVGCERQSRRIGRRVVMDALVGRCDLVCCCGGFVGEIID